MQIAYVGLDLASEKVAFLGKCFLWSLFTRTLGGSHFHECMKAEMNGMCAKAVWGRVNKRVYKSVCCRG